MHKFIPLVLVSSALAAESCAPSTPASCNQVACAPCYCLGPITVQANSPVRPYTCDGDFVLTASALYWKAAEDGLEYMIENHQLHDFSDPTVVLEKSLIDATYHSPKGKYQGGFKFGMGYNSPCDGWDLELEWTKINTIAVDQHNSLFSPNNPNPFNSITAIWSAFQAPLPGPHYANKTQATWNCDLNRITLDLGREYWVSKYLSIRPTIGLAYLDLLQKLSITYEGGPWIAAEGDVSIDNDYRGIGVHSGLDTQWNFGCGWSLACEMGVGIVYGRFEIAHDESTRQSNSPFSKRKILETKDSFRASRPVFDFLLGVQYATLVCDCKYGFSAMLGWEKHLFFDQNQMWRVNRINGIPITLTPPNNTGENDFSQRRGTLSLSGLTLKLAFAF